jgi:hypothetical protein
MLEVMLAPFDENHCKQHGLRPAFAHREFAADRGRRSLTGAAPTPYCLDVRRTPSQSTRSGVVSPELIGLDGDRVAAAISSEVTC